MLDSRNRQKIFFRRENRPQSKKHPSRSRMREFEKAIRPLVVSGEARGVIRGGRGVIRGGRGVIRGGRGVIREGRGVIRGDPAIIFSEKTGEQGNCLLFHFQNLFSTFKT